MEKDIEQRVKALESELARVQAQLRNAMMEQPPVDLELDSRARRLIDLLAPERAAGLGLVRLGSAFDGGYVVPGAWQFDRVVSFGIGGNCDFEEELAARGAAVVAFDHTIAAYPAAPTDVVWRAQALAPMASAERVTLAEAIADVEGTLLVKVDVEGDEWATLAAVQQAVLLRVDCLVVEFHGLDRLMVEQDWQRMLAVLERLRKSFALVHIHANNAGPTYRADGHSIPSIVECTYVSWGSAGARGPATGPWPTPLDAPNLPAFPDIPLSGLWGDPAGAGA